MTRAWNNELDKEKGFMWSSPFCPFSSIIISPLELLDHSWRIQKNQLIQVNEAKQQETEEPQTLWTLFPHAIDELSLRFLP